MRLFYEQLMDEENNRSSYSALLTQTIVRFRSLTLADSQQMLQQSQLSSTEIEHGLSALLSLPGTQPDTPWRDADRPFDHPYFWAAFILVGEPWSRDREGESQSGQPEDLDP